MGINNFLSFQKSWQSSPSLLLTLAGQTLNSIVCKTTPPGCLPSFLALTLFLPVLLLSVHLSSTRGITSRYRVQSSTVTARSLQDGKPS